MLAVLVLAAPLFLGTALVVETARRTKDAWRIRKQTAILRGYRDLPSENGWVSIRPPQLLALTGLAAVLGSTAIWPLTVAASLVRVHGATGPLAVAVLVSLAMLLATVTALALRLLARRPGAGATARAGGTVALFLGALVAVPMVAWPPFFGAFGLGESHGLFIALGIFAALGGLVLARAGSLVETTELEQWAQPALFDEA